MTRPRLLSALLIAVAIMLSALSGAVHRDLRRTNGLFFLFPMELLALPVGGAAAGRILQARRDLAPGMLGAGVYLMAVAGAVSTIYPIWLPEDDTILGSALLAGLWAGVGANLALTSAAILASRSSRRTSTISTLAGVLTFVIVTIGPWVSPLFRLEIPLVTVAAVAIVAIAIAHRQGVRLVQPLLLAVAGGVGTLAVLLRRGPGDWASASNSLKLYSSPILLMAIGVIMALIDIVRDRNWPLDCGTRT